MARPKSITTLIEEAKARGETLGNYPSWAKKLSAERNAKKGQGSMKAKGVLKCKRIVKAFIETNDVKAASEKVGISRAMASKYLNSEQGIKMFKDVFSEIGLDKDSIAKITKEEFLEYNKSRVTRLDALGNEYEEMRDGKLAFKALQFAASKLEADKQEIEINQNININSNTATLAIKQLLNQVDDISTLEELLSMIQSKLNVNVIEVN